jgi:predicted methyltransferase
MPLMHSPFSEHMAPFGWVPPVLSPTVGSVVAVVVTLVALVVLGPVVADVLALVAAVVVLTVVEALDEPLSSPSDSPSPSPPSATSIFGPHAPRANTIALTRRANIIVTHRAYAGRIRGAIGGAGPATETRERWQPAGASRISARMRTPRLPVMLLATTLAAALACSVSTSSSTTPPPSGAGKPVPPSESAGKPIAAETPKEPDPPQPDPAADRKKRLEAAIAELEAEAAKEKDRWTPELVEKVKSLQAKKFRTSKEALRAALASPHRKPGHAERDDDRHPLETMAFFGLRPNMRVFEVGPGEGWWTELLAIVLYGSGKLVLATTDPKSDDPTMAYFGRAMQLMLTTPPTLYERVETIEQASASDYNLGPDESLDMVLVMRMMHNLIRFNEGKNLDKLLAKSFAALKPGGVLAIEQHRAAEGADPLQSAQKGYVPQKWLIERIESAGFELAGKSEINANPKDTKDYEKGVWTLPPVLVEGDKDKDRYIAIGESDRMTLKFVKPKKPRKAAAKAATGSVAAPSEKKPAERGGAVE